jgi:glyoxylase-like metal-dependent hydrolase (beta-lactamase superfamily II)
VDVTRLVVGPLATNCYILAAGDKRVIIDAGAGAEEIRAALGGGEVLAIIATHGHNDHVDAVDSLVALTGAPFMVPAADAALAGRSVETSAATLLEDGATLDFPGISLDVIATPGHTPGCVCLYAPPLLFSGDTLFAGGVGRFDLPGGSSDALFDSIKERIFVLPDETDVLPGHGPATTVGREKRSNPFFSSAWV